MQKNNVVMHLEDLKKTNPKLAEEIDDKYQCKNQLEAKERANTQWEVPTKGCHCDHFFTDCYSDVKLPKKMQVRWTEFCWEVYISVP